MIIGTAGTNFLKAITIYKVDKVMVSKFGYLMLPGAFPDIESYPYIDFTHEVIVQCYVPVVKILL